MFTAKVPFYYYLKTATFSADGLLQAVTAFHTTRDVMSFTPVEEFGREKFLSMVEYGHYFITRLPPSGEVVNVILVDGPAGEGFVVKGKPWIEVNINSKV